MIPPFLYFVVQLCRPSLQDVGFISPSLKSRLGHMTGHVVQSLSRV